MPELPEVETTIRGLKTIRNKKIIKIQIHTNKLRYKISNNLSKLLLGSKIVNIRRIAKYIILDFNNNFTLIMHLGMSGRLKINNFNIPKLKHDHLVIYFNNKKKLIFNDPRKFGFIHILKTNDFHKNKFISNIGVDALSKKLDHQYLAGKISHSQVPIKQILLNQKIVAGIGNIYASEILFDAKISPLIRGKDLKIRKIIILLSSIRKILNKAIKYGGSSIRDYRSADGTIGNFQSNFKVYGKQGELIGKYKILKIVQYGRSTFYCPGIQKIK